MGDNYLKNFSRMYSITNSGYGGWTNSDRTEFVIEFRSNLLYISKRNYRDMFPEEINYCFQLFFNDYVKEYGKVEMFEREGAFRFAYKQSKYGCQDVFMETISAIEYLSDMGYPRRKHLIHLSSNEKCAGISGINGFDFIDFLVTGGIIEIRDGYYSVPENDTPNNKKFDVSVTKPRLFQYEEGWTCSYWNRKPVVKLQTVREKPAEETEEAEETGGEEEE